MVYMKKRVLFICTHNSARSQMAEGLLNAFLGDKFEGFSAGIKPTKINPYVIRVMAEIGVDVSKHHTRSIMEFRRERFDYVVTVCDDAREACPFFPGDNVLHKSFANPSEFKGSDYEVLQKVRLVRDEIKDWLKKIFDSELRSMDRLSISSIPPHQHE